MTVEVWMSQPYKTTHERQAVDQFVAAMQEKFGQSNETYFILINFFIDGREIDLTVLKKDAIIVIELKEYDVPFEASENGKWDKIGTGNENPFQQAKAYRFNWVNYLEANKAAFLPSAKANNLDFYHASAFVAISPSLHPATKNEIPNLPWFRLVGLDQLPQAIAQKTSPKLNFSPDELRILVRDCLRLNEADPANLWSDGPAQNEWVEYCQTLRANHRQWSQMSDQLFISPEEMELAPTKVTSNWHKISNILFTPDSQKFRLYARFVNIIPAEGQDFFDFVVEQHQPTVIFGSPGMGKSVALERLVLKFADDFVHGQTDFVPVYVSLRRYNSQTRNLNHLIGLALQYGKIALNTLGLEESLRAKKFLFAFDGLDEALNDPEIIPNLEDFIQRYSHHKFIISSRPYLNKLSQDTIQNCQEVTLLPPNKQAAEILWRNFVKNLPFQTLPDEVQEVFRIPLLLRLLSYATSDQFDGLTGEIQYINVIVNNLMKRLKINRGDIVERSLNRLALDVIGEGKYWFESEVIEDVVRELLTNESVAYQQEITEKVRKSPFLTPMDNFNFSFWHPVFQEYFAAQGLRDAILRDGSVESVLTHIGDPRIHNSLFHLVQILPVDDATKIVEYARDYSPSLAMNCVLQMKAPPEKLVTSSFDDLIQGISDEAATLVEFGRQFSFGFILGSQLVGTLFTSLLLRGYRVNFTKVGELFGFSIGRAMEKVVDYIAVLLKSTTEFEIQASRNIEPAIVTLLQSQQKTERIIGLYWAEELLASDIKPTQGFLESLEQDSTLNFDDNPELILQMRVRLKILPKLKSEDDLIPYWESMLQIPDDHPYYKLVQTYATLGLAATPFSLGSMDWWDIMSLQGGHQMAQIRFIAIHAMGIEGVTTTHYFDDPNPLVRHIAAIYVINDVHDSDDEFRLAVEYMISPFLGKLSSEELKSEFVEFEYLNHSIDVWTSPYRFWRKYIGATLLLLAAEDDMDNCVCSRLLALIWAIGVYKSNKPDWSQYAAKKAKVKIFLEQLKNKELILSDEDILYIKSWTDHDTVREITAKILSNEYELTLPA